MNSELLQKYEALVNQYNSISISRQKQLKIISLARFISFLSILPAYFYLNSINSTSAYGVSFTFLIIFLFLIKKYIRTEKQLDYYQRLVEINKNEYAAILREFSVFDSGNEFIDPHHDYSFDLDLYGKGSFFQFMNRTVTNRGKKRLSAILNRSERSAKEIQNRQEAIQELAEDLNWRQNFMAVGKETEAHKNQIRVDDSIQSIISLKHDGTARYLPLIFPFFILTFIGLYLAEIVTSQIFLVAFLIQSIIYLTFFKTINKFYRKFESQAKILGQYVAMLQQIETAKVKSPYLLELKAQLSGENKPASKITGELQKIITEFDYRQNFILAFVLNLIFLWDIRCISKLYTWQQKYTSCLPKWFEVIAEIDALISLANCNYNHPEWVLPIISDSGFNFKAENLGHPLIDAKRCVCNSFKYSGEEQIVIITGANMAGKSTFLRTVGINLILASNGCMVCASNFEFSPVRIYTNMRTSDNLMNDESYFYAELLRLQSLLQLIRNGENLFVIVDEMLKGTNSIDKLNGSIELITRLISLKTHGIVATHDLGLTELARQNPTLIKNQCFEVNLKDNELTFDYKLTDGVTRTMNATFLMKKMGIIPENSH